MLRDCLLYNIKKHLFGADDKGALPATIDHGTQIKLNTLFDGMLSGAQQYFNEAQINANLALMQTDLQKATQLARPFLNKSFPGLIIQAQIMAQIHMVLVSNMSWKDILIKDMARLSEENFSISTTLLRHFKRIVPETNTPNLVEALKFYQLLTTNPKCLRIGRFLINIFRTNLKERKCDIVADLKSAFLAYMRDCQNASAPSSLKRRPKALSPIVTDIKSKKDPATSTVSFEELKAKRIQRRDNRLPFWSEVESKEPQHVSETNAKRAEDLAAIVAAL